MPTRGFPDANTFIPTDVAVQEVAKVRSRSKASIAVAGVLAMGVSNAASSGKTALQLQRRLQTKGKRGDGDSGHVTIVEPEEVRRRRQDGFLISFRLSIAYRALERQEIIAGKPNLTPQKVKRSKSKQKKVTIPIDKKPDIPKTKTNFWKQMMAVKKIPVSAGSTPLSTPPQDRTPKVSPTRKCKGRSKSPKPANTNMEDSQAVKEWQRRRNIRKQNRMSRKDQIKISKQTNTTRRPKSAPTATSGSPRRRSPRKRRQERTTKTSMGATDTETRRRAMSPVSSRPLIPLPVTPRPTSTSGTTSGDRPSISTTADVGRFGHDHVDAGSTIYGSTRLGSVNSSDTSLFSDRSRLRRRNSRRTGQATAIATPSVAPLNLTQLTSGGGGTAAKSIGRETRGPTPPRERSRYARKLASKRMQIPKPEKETRTALAAPAITRPPGSRPQSVAGSTASGDKGSDLRPKLEINYRACKYLYAMCHCRQVGSNKTINKLQKFRKISGVIDIFGCPKDDVYLNSDLVCPFCRVFPRKKVNAWLEDQEEYQPLHILSCR